MEEEAHSRHEAESQEGIGTRYDLQRYTPNGLRPPTRLYLPKTLSPPKTVPPAGDQTLNT